MLQNRYRQTHYIIFIEKIKAKTKILSFLVIIPKK